MRVKVYVDSGNFGAGYTESLLTRLCQQNKIDTAKGAKDADVLLVSMCDPSDLPLLLAARRECTGQPVVLGGFESYFGEPYLAWADAVNVGEGFEFFSCLGAGGDWRSLPCVLTRDKPAFASYRVDWPSLPVVRTGKKKTYYLAARGCHNKCKFCATSWVQPYQHNDTAAVERAVRQSAAHGCKLTLICNDSRGLPRARTVNAASVTIRDYLAAPAKYKATMLHFGVEGWTEAERAEYGKPISDADLAALVDVTREHGQRSEWFFIAGRAGWSLDSVREFVSRLPQDTNHLPPIHAKLTYFDPCPHTPLARACPATEYVDTEKCFRVFNAHNKRFRVFPVRSLARSNWRTVLHRCTPEQALALGREPTDTNTPESRASWVACLRPDLARLAHEITEQPRPLISVRHKNVFP